MIKYRLKVPFYLAWQYLRRGRKWTLVLTIVLVAIAFLNLLFMPSLLAGVVEGSNQTVRNTTSGDIYITPKSGETAIASADEVSGKIRRIPGVVGVSSQTIIPGTLEFNGITGQGAVYAVRPSDESKTRTLVSDTQPGFLADEDRNGIILGRQIAGGEGVENDAFSFKNAQVGDEVSLTLGAHEKTFVVRGILDTGFVTADTLSYITLGALSEIAPELDDMATTIIVKTDTDADLDTILASIRALDLQVSAYTWKDASGMMASISSSFTSINALMTTVGILIAAITVFVIIYVDISNKRRQIGVFKAIGIAPSIIVSSYLLLASVYAVTGIALGTIMFYGVAVPYFEANPFVLPIADVKLFLTPSEYIWRAEVVFWAAIVSGLIPSLIVSRAKMLDSILGTR